MKNVLLCNRITQQPRSHKDIVCVQQKSMDGILKHFSEMS